jgi:hypothetical protein
MTKEQFDALFEEMLQDIKKERENKKNEKND